MSLLLVGPTSCVPSCLYPLLPPLLLLVLPSDCNSTDPWLIAHTLLQKSRCPCVLNTAVQISTVLWQVIAPNSNLILPIGFVASKISDIKPSMCHSFCKHQQEYVWVEFRDYSDPSELGASGYCCWSLAIWATHSHVGFHIMTFSGNKATLSSLNVFYSIYVPKVKLHVTQ